MGDLSATPDAVARAAPEAELRHGLEGSRVPSVSFRVLGEDGALHDVRSVDVFAGRTVVLIGLPGAFTPTCSSAHVPRFSQLASEFGARGVHRIVCTAVNDPYVMAAWAKAQRADRILFLPDAEGVFSRALGLLVDRRESGLGLRSRRYAMLVRDGRIERAFVEPDGPGDPFGVSDADTMLAYLDPKAPALVPVAMFTRRGCPHCAHARRLLDEYGLRFEEIELDDRVTITAVRAVTGRSTLPQVFVRGRWIGGADDLASYLEVANAAPVEAAAGAP